MTSKQLLSKLKHDKAYTEYIECLEKDLEVLEILKNHYDKDSELLSSGKFISFSVFSCDDEFNKVKEWLDDTKKEIMDTKIVYKFKKSV